MKKGIGKRILALFLVLTMVLGMCTGCGEKETVTESTEMTLPEGVLSKGEWIEALASTFGMTDYSQEEAFFTDVTIDNELFAMVQASAEWGFFEETGGELGLETGANREFVAASAIIASEAIEATGENKFPTYEEALAYAKEQNLLTDAEDLEEFVGQDEAQKWLNWAEETYTKEDFVPVEHMVYADGVVDLSAEAGVEVSENTVVIPASVEAEIAEGSVLIIAPTLMAPSGQAGKVVSVTTDSRGNRTVTIETPELKDVYKELKLSQRIEPTAENFHLAEGVTLAMVDAEDNYRLTSTARNVDQKVSKRFQFGVKWVVGDGIVVNANAPDLGDFESKLIFAGMEEERREELLEIFKDSGYAYDAQKKELEKFEPKYNNELSIGGTITFNELYFIANVEYDNLGFIDYVDKLELTIGQDTELAVAIEGEVEGEYPLGYALVPLPCGLTIKVDFVLSVDVNGNITVSSLGSTSRLKMTYEIGKPWKKVPYAQKKEPKVEVNANLGADVGLGVELAAFTVCLAEIQAEYGADFIFTGKPGVKDTETTEEIGGYEKVTTTRAYTFHRKIELDYPVITVMAGIGEEGLARGEAEQVIYGSKGLKKTKTAVLEDKEYDLFTEQSVYWPGLDTMTNDGHDRFVEFIEGPANANLSYSNFYKAEGLEEKMASMGIEANAEEKYNFLGAYASYSTEPRYYVDGTVEEGSSLSISADDGEGVWYNSYSVLYYDETDLEEVVTHIMKIDEKTTAQIPGVGGFSLFLRREHCMNTLKLAQLFELGEEFETAIKADNGEYTKEFQVPEYGRVKITVESEKRDPDYYIYSKCMYIEFDEGSACPYTYISIKEGFPANYLGEINTFWITAYTPADGE